MTMKTTTYQPGQNIIDIKKKYRLKKVIKLASNENPSGPSYKALIAGKKILNSINRYPDSKSVELRQIIKKYLSKSYITTDNIIMDLANTFKEMTKAVMQLGRDNCDGKVVMAHEGGYSELHVPFCGHAVLEEMSESLIEVPDPLHSRISGQQPSNEFNEFVLGNFSGIEGQIFGNT